jgi:leucyl/phenylalanyl-tRNA--protein transferase
MPIQLLPNETFLPNLPEILEPYEEFGALRDVSPDAVAAVCRNGYMPMGLRYDEQEILLIKCHRERCVVDPAEIHVPGNTRRYARGLRLAIDRSPAETLTAIDGSHSDSWLTPRLQGALLVLAGGGTGCEAGAGPETGVGPVPADERSGAVRVHTIELLDEADGTAVAWEIGYAVGRVYTSLSGAHRRNGSGWVQLVSLATVLHEAGFTMWDLGMEIEYKLRLGCRLLARDAFLSAYRAAAGGGPGSASPLPLPAGICARSAPELVEIARGRSRRGTRTA